MAKKGGFVAYSLAHSFFGGRYCLGWKKAQGSLCTFGRSDEVYKELAHRFHCYDWSQVTGQSRLRVTQILEAGCDQRFPTSLRCV